MRVVLLSKAYVLASYHSKAAEIASLGVDLTLVAPPFWRDERGVMAIEPVAPRGYRQVVLPIALNGHYHLHWNRGLNRLLSEVRPDILHVEEEPFNLAAFLAVAAARRVGAKAIFFTWQNLGRRYPPPFSLFERYCYRASSHAIAGNQDAVAVLRAKGYAGPVSVLPQFGVDPELFSPREREPEEFVVGYVGRLMPEKGVDLVLRALALVERPWSLLLLGSGPAEASLRRLAASLGVEAAVEFLAPIPSRELPTHMHRLSILVLPSRSLPNWREQFGRVLVEAMACGVPVIGSTSGEIPSVIGEAGLLFPEGDVAALAEALSRLRADSALRLLLSTLGRERVLARYTQASIALETVAIYGRVLAKGTARHRS